MSEPGRSIALVSYAAACATVVVIACRAGGGAPAPPRVLLPIDRAEQIQAAVRLANAVPGDAPTWRVLGAHEAAGLVVEHYRLGEGLELLAVDGGPAPAFSYQTWFSTGLADDPLAIRGRAGRAVNLVASPSGASVRALEARGARLAAGATSQLTFFSVTAPGILDGKPVLPHIVEREATRFCLRELSQNTLEAALRPAPLRAGSTQWTSDELYSRMQALLRSALTPALAYSAPAPLTAATLRAELGRIYDPALAVVVVSGGYDRSALLLAMRKSYCSKAGAPRGDSAAPEEGSSGEGRADSTRALRAGPPHSLPSPGGQARALFGWRFSTPDPKDQVAMEALVHILADGAESRGGEALLGKWVTALEARIDEGASESTLELMIALAPSVTATAALAPLRVAIDAVARGETTGREIERARTRLEGLALWELSQLEGRARAAAEALLLRGHPDALALRLQAIEALSEPDVRGVATRWLVRRPVVVMTTAPEKTPPEVSP